MAKKKTETTETLETPEVTEVKKTTKKTKKTVKTSDTETISLATAKKLIKEAVAEQKEELKGIVEELKPKSKAKASSEVKEIKVTVRLDTEKERENLNAVAKKRGLSTNEYIKFLIKEFPKLERKLKKIENEGN